MTFNKKIMIWIFLRLNYFEPIIIIFIEKQIKNFMRNSTHGRLLIFSL